jgi:hypothetical protein
MADDLVGATFTELLAAFRGCFTAPSYANFCALMLGWVHCLGRHTITAVALASGVLGRRHISALHRFFGRARWELDAVGRVAFELALQGYPTDQPVLLVLDDTLARKSGKCVSLASMHHDPLLSSPGKGFCSFGHVWVTLAVWRSLPMQPERGYALPVACRLFVGSRHGGQRDAVSRRTAGRRQRSAQLAADGTPTRTKLELARELLEVVSSWAPERTFYVVADSLYAGRAVLEHRPANVELISRLRLDAALWTPPAPRRPGQTGRPRRRGNRLPSPQALAATRRHWHRLSLTLYGRAVSPLVFRLTALWYIAQRSQPVRIVVVRDPTGRRRDEAFFCTDCRASAAMILTSYARRWTLEVAFHDAKQCLGFEDPQNQTPEAVRRTAPLAFVSYDLVLLSAASCARQGQPVHWIHRPWYRSKSAPSFADMLTAVRFATWPRLGLFDPPSRLRCRRNWPPPWPHALLATA